MEIKEMLVVMFEDKDGFAEDCLINRERDIEINKEDRFWSAEDIAPDAEEGWFNICGSLNENGEPTDDFLIIEQLDNYGERVLHITNRVQVLECC